MKISKKDFKSGMIYCLAVIAGIVILLVGNKLTTNGYQLFGKYGAYDVYRAKVEIIVGETYTDQEGAGVDLDIFFEGRIRTGSRKGELVFAEQFISSMSPIKQKPVQVGDKVLLYHADYDNQGKTWMFHQYDRTNVIAGLIIFFLALVLLFGGKKGFSTIIALGLTMGCVFYFFLPSIFAGFNIYLATILVCIYVIAFTLILVNGVSYKTISAGIGCIGGLVISGLIFKIMNTMLELTGLIDEDSNYLLMLDRPIDLHAIIFSSILIGVLGAVLDVGVSIASSLHEIYPEGGEYTLKQVMASGMNIGRDIISTMTNTLILVYIGSSLSTTLLLVAYSNSFFELINRESIVVEVLQSIIGSIGLVFTIPLTSFFYGLGITRGVGKKTAAKASAAELELEPIKGEIIPNKMPEELKKAVRQGTAKKTEK